MGSLRKRLSIFLISLIITSMLGATSYAASSSDFVVKNGVLKEYKGNETNVIIPANLGITRIDDWAFYCEDNMVSVTIPEGVTVLGEGGYPDAWGAFFQCGKLKQVVLPNSLKIIGDSAFLDCGSLESINIPNSVTTIGWGAFQGTGLTSVNIPYNVTSIGGYAFSSTNLKEITISNSISILDQGTFSNCKKLESITLPSTLKSIGDQAFSYCTSLKSIVIPKGVTTMGDALFMHCGNNLVTVNIPSSVTSIGGLLGAKSEADNHIFYDCNNVAIYGEEGSFAHTYANKHSLKFVSNIPNITATPTKSTVLVNSKLVAFQAYNINGNNYFKLRDIAKILSGTGNQFEVGWDGVNNAIALTIGLVYTPVGGELTTSGGNTNTAATSSTSKVYINGSMVSLTAYTIGGNNYFKLRDIGMAIGFSVDWDSANNSIKIGTTATSVNTPSSDNGKKMQIIYSGSGDEIDNLSQYVNSVLYHAEGFQFPASTEKYNGKYVVPYLCFTADNSNRAYEMLTFFAATDDRSTNKGNVLYVGTTTDGYVFDWKNFNVWDASQDIKLQSDCFTKYKFNFANFNKVTVYLVPATTTNDYYFEDGKILSTGQALETSMVMNGAYLK